jgi:2-oxoisovalerate dehydrogenase E1 component alpha subunit
MEFVQLLTEKGEPRADPRYPLDLADEHYRRLYRDMVLTRRLDREGTALARQGELGMWIPCLGQEAAQVGAAHAVTDGDHVFPAYREHGVALCRGVDPLDLMGMFRGVTNGGWDTAAHGFHLYTIVIGAQTLHATGYAMGLRLRGATGAVLACFGDGASSQGDVSEAFTFAAVFDAPVVFYCQNNQWAISEPTERQTRVPLYQRAAAFGFPGVRVDGNDVLACLAVTRAALAHARSGAGPYLIEAHTYRMGPHTTADDPSRYRPVGELERWTERDPVARLRAFLTRQGLTDTGFFEEVDAEGEALAKRVREGVRAMAEPPDEALFRHVYATEHPLVARERAEHQAFLATLAPGVQS